MKAVSYLERIFVANGNKVDVYEQKSETGRLKYIENFPFSGKVKDLDARPAGVLVLVEGNKVDFISGVPNQFYSVNISSKIRNLKRISEDLRVCN